MKPEVKDIIRVLCRVPVEKNHLALFHLAHQNPNGFSSDQIRELLGITRAQQSGVMAKLGRRVNDTPREIRANTKPTSSLLFFKTWDDTQGQNTYKPRPELIEAIEILKPLKELIAKSPEEVRGTDTLSLKFPDGVEQLPAIRRASTETPPESESESEKSKFDKLLDSFAEKELVFPTELAANVLLALQVKRFVILAGISGSGKTRMAQALADQFPVQNEVSVPVQPDDEGVLITVRPYMLKYNRVVLPVSLVLQLPELMDSSKSRTLLTQWQDEETELTVSLSSGTTPILLLRRPVTDWFKSTFSVGDTFVISAVGENDESGGPRRLRLRETEKSESREERIENSVVMPVRPDWNDHRGLLGTYNPLTSQYLTTSFLRLLLDAQAEVARAESKGRDAEPFFLILDEMNLARVEHYFADFLSAMESEEPLHLHDSIRVEEGLLQDEEDGLSVPRSLKIPPNVFFIGTVNVDESTYMFSPKVLDRAFTIEFNSIDLNGLSDGIERGGELDLPKWGGSLRCVTQPSRSDWLELQQVQGGEIVKMVLEIHEPLLPYNRHFGYRVVNEISRFVRLAIDQSADPEAARMGRTRSRTASKGSRQVTRHSQGAIKSFGRPASLYVDWEKGRKVRHHSVDICIQ